MIYILGYNSFIGKHIYLEIKKKYPNILLLSHLEINILERCTEDDIVINCCGVNRGEKFEDYDEGNNLFVQKICSLLNGFPYLIHFSSLMVHGFKNLSFDNYPNYQKWFIESKLNGEKYLLENYDRNKLSIIRPSNVFGYDCKPYYNNLLCTLMYEKIKDITSEKKINKNCYRNFISVNSLSQKICEHVGEKRSGIFDILSNNTISLEEMINHLYAELPSHIKITDEAESIPNNSQIKEQIIINEDISQCIKDLERDMKVYLDLVSNVPIRKKDVLRQGRGDMVEITDLKSKRLYKITITKNSVRGNHYHFEQIEDFYINKGKVLFVLSYSYSPEIRYVFTSYENDLVRINPHVIHTVVNDFSNNLSEIIITSTQEHVANEIPDTKYVTII